MSAPIKIPRLPYVEKFTESRNGKFEEGWRYYPTPISKEESLAPEQLRIEIVTRTESGRVRYECRLVKGQKHLEIIRMRGTGRRQLDDVVWRLVKSFFEKGW